MIGSTKKRTRNFSQLAKWHVFLFLIVLANLPVGFARAQEKDAPQAEEGKKAEKKEEGLPLKPTRKISFTTEEGTWMSLDVSPEGKSLVFDLLGDLYLLPIEGGEAKRLTSGLPWDCQPRFSPDGKQIAFISDRSGSDNIWLINEDGSNPRAVTKETDDQLGSPAWTPDGNYLVARKWGPYPGAEDYLRITSLWLFHKNGGKGLELVKGKGKTTVNEGPYFARDGKLLYFSSHPEGFRYNVDIGRFQVYTFNRDTGEVQTITDVYGGGLRPIVSPDGRFLVYASCHDAKTGLRIRDLSSREEHWLVSSMQRDDQEGFAVNDILPGYAFTPDSKSVLYTGDGKIQRVDITSHQIAAVPFSAKVDLDLGPRIRTEYAIKDGPLPVHQMRWTNQSPEGKTLVYSAVGKIWLTDTNGDKPRRLTSSPLHEYEPIFSPDGKWIAFVSWSDSEGGQLWKAPASGGEPVQLSKTAAYYSQPVWSPDGGKIMFVAGSASGWLSGDDADVEQLSWMSSNGGEIHSIVTLPGGGQTPAFSGDGERVYYMEAAPPNPNAEGAQRPARLLRSIRLDGVDKKTLMRFEGPFVSAIPSPDGEWVAVLDRSDAYLAALPKVGDEVVSINMKAPPVPVKRLTTQGANYLYWADEARRLRGAMATIFRAPNWKRC